MLSEEEKKAIKLIKQYRKEIKDGDIKPIFILDTAINLITKLQKENEILKRAFDKQTADMSNNLLELRQKDKQIDLMAEVMFKNNTAQLIIEYGIENKEQIIKEFEKLVKEKGE